MTLTVYKNAEIMKHSASVESVPSGESTLLELPEMQEASYETTAFHPLIKSRLTKVHYALRWSTPAGNRRQSPTSEYKMHWSFSPEPSP